MLKLNAFLKEKNVEFSPTKNKSKVVELVQDNSVPAEDIFMLSIFIRLR